MTVAQSASDMKGCPLIVVGTPGSEIGSHGCKLKHLQVMCHDYFIQEACEVQALEGEAARVLREDLDYLGV